MIWPYETDRNWQNKLRPMVKSMINVDPRFAKLRKKLLSIDGAEVVPRPEPDIDKILERGKTFNYRVTVIKGMMPNRCHANAAFLWLENPKRHIIVTGYVLANDGLWRQHSWTINPLEKVIMETIEQDSKNKILYHGTVLTDKECEQFMRDNIKC